jgi:hypothetical protein
LQQTKAVVLVVLDKLKSLPSSIAELFADLFADLFAKGINSLLVQQNKKLASRKEFPLILPELLIKETLLIYKKGKKRVLQEEEIEEERKQDALQQYCCNKKAAAVLAAANIQLEEQEQGRREEEDLVEAAWVADTQLRLSQLSYLDTDEEQYPRSSSSSPDTLVDAANNRGQAELGSQAQPVEISSSNKTDRDGEEPRRSGCTKCSTRALELQQ